ncbi:MAG: metalloprotease [Allomuricauda sp.]|nr:MAG: metalloprotease [Allomuricauda sp.]
MNNSDQVLSVLYFNDWNHSYSNKNTALTKRFGNEFNRSLHLAKFKERGRTQITTVVDKQYRGLNWERTGKRDIIRIILNEALEPGGSAQIFLTYSVKLPNNKFTGYGYTNEGEYFLENWYLSPAVFSDSEWKPYSNKNLNDIYTDVCNTTVNLIFPPELFFASNYAFETSSQFPGGQQITVKGNQRKNCVVHLTRQREYVIHKTRAMTLTTNLQGGSKYEPSFRSVSIDKVTSFLYDNLGDYPHDNLLVSELDYNRSPLYGLSQLPSFIRPYKEQFQFEMAFLKTALDNYLKESLYLDPRKDQWVFHAIANYLTIKYVEENYPNQKLTGQLSRIWGLRSYHFSQMHFNDQYYYLQMASVRRNDHQALATPNDSLTRWNHKIANRYKAGLGMAYLAEYIGYDKLEAALKEFYTENKLTPGVSAEQLKQKLTEKTDLDINWFFDEYVALRNNIDFKITEVSKENDSISFTIKNKTGSNVPISLFGLQKDSVISKYWFSDIDSTKTYAIPDNNETRLVLNYDQKIPEVNQGNNWKNVNGFLSNKKLQFRFLQDTENPFFNQIFYVPEFNFNVNDGLSGGISFKNKPLLIRKPFIYQIKPRYSTKEQTIVGSAGFSYQEFFNEGKLNSITYSFSGRSSFFDTNSRFNTLTPAVSFNWRPEDFVSNRRQFLLFRLRNVFRNIDDEIIDQIDTEPDFTVFNVRYGDVDNNILRFRSWVVDGQLSGNFSKLSFEWEQRTLFNNNRQLNLRFYAGKFITNTSNSDFFSFALDRPTDYLFDLDYLNRSQSASGLSSQQFILAEGGFKSIFDDRFGNDWIATGNLSFNVWQWIELYGDIGAIRNRGEDARFLYGYGVRLNLVTDFFELYFPIYSNNGYEIAQPNYGERIRFVVTISPKTLTRLFTRKWF